MTSMDDSCKSAPPSSPVNALACFVSCSKCFGVVSANTRLILCALLRSPTFLFSFSAIFCCSSLSSLLFPPFLYSKRNIPPGSSPASLVSNELSIEETHSTKTATSSSPCGRGLPQPIPVPILSVSLFLSYFLPIAKPLQPFGRGSHARFWLWR